jgi:hypothetical protein
MFPTIAGCAGTAGAAGSTLGAETGSEAMIKGECLCGAVQFEVASVVGPFELCHCNRCRKSSGSAYAAIVGVAVEGFRVTSGAKLIRSFELPVVERPPGYRRFFCQNCGSPLPNPTPVGNWLGIPAGCLKEEPGLFPDKHIYVECKAGWDKVTDGLPQFTKDQIRTLRKTN